MVARMNTRVRWGVLCTLGILFAFVILVALAPVSTVVRDGVPVGGTGSKGDWQRSSQPVESDLVIEQTKPGKTFVLAPKLVFPEVLPADAVKTTGTYVYDESRKAYVGSGPGSLKFSCFCGDIKVALGAPSTTPVQVTRTSGTSVLEKQLSPPGGSNLVSKAELASPDAEYVRSSAYMFRSVQPNLSGSPSATFGISVGSAEIVSKTTSTVSSLQILPVVVGLVLQGVAILALSFLVMLLFWIVGRLLDPSDEHSAPREAVRTIFGAALLMVVINSLAYVIAVKLAVGLAALAIVALATYRARWRRPRSIGAGLRVWSKIAAVVAIPTTFLFFPIFYWGLHFVGEYKTDLGEYSSLASLVTDHSLFDMRNSDQAQGAGVLTSGAGFAWRSVDSVAAAALNVVTGLGTVQSFGLLGIVLACLFGFGLVGLSMRSNQRRWLIVAAAAMLAPPVTGLFVENYISHYFFVAFVPGLLLVLGLAIRAAEQGASPRWANPYLTWAAGGIVAVTVAVYPYFAVILMAALAVAALLRRSWRLALWRVGIPVALKALLLCNLVLMTVVNYGETVAYQDRLNALASGYLLEPFDAVQRAGLIGGVTSFQLRLPGSDSTSAFGFPVQELVGLAQFLQTSAWVYGLVGLCVAVGLGIGVAWRRWIRNYESVGAAVLLFVWLAVGLYLWSAQSDYAAFKILWTFGALLPLLFATAPWRHARFKLVLALFLPISICWVAVDFVDRAGWMVSQQSAMQRASHASLVTDILGAKDALAGASSVEVVAGAQPIAGSDRDVVSTMLLAAEMNDAGVVFVRKSEPPPDRGNGVFILWSGVGPKRAPLSEACRVPADAIVVFGRSGRSTLCGQPLVFAGDIVEVFR